VKVSNRKLKVLCQAGKVDHNTWLRALEAALEGQDQYLLEDRSVLKLAS
jgi:hypothetical protein